MEETFDIFISYRVKDGELISQKVANALKDMGFSVYHNTDKNHKGKFPDRIRIAVDNCKDFLLIVTENCLDRLVRDDNSGNPDWVKEELLEAIDCGKNIIPVMIENIDWPKDLSGLSDETASLIRNLSYLENIRLPVNFEQEPPLILLCGKLDSKPNAGGLFRYQKYDPKYIDVNALLAQLTDEANRGNPVAMYQLAFFYCNGLSDTPRNIEKEYYWLQKLLAVEDESDEVKKYKAHALWQISSMYYCGDVPGEKQSFANAYKYREMAGELCPNDFLSSVALMRLWGSGVKFDYEDIITTIENTDLESAYVMEIFHIAKFYEKYGDFAHAIDLYLRICDVYDEASYNLGRLYLLGVDTTPPEPDGVKAAHYLTEATYNGHTEAAFELGRLYFNPPISKTRSKNIHQNIKKAVRYLKIAASNNHTEALYLLGWIYCNNLGVQDPVKAIEYAEKAAKNGSIDAMIDLIHLYQCKECKNYERACYYAVKVAESNESAALRAGYFYLFGCGCEPNLNEAKKYFRLALKSHAPEAEYMLNLIKEIEKRDNVPDTTVMSD